MRFRICKSFEIENGHMLAKHPDKCRFPHGHSRKVECVLSSNSLDANEMVCDFKLLKNLLSDFLDEYDHALCMNTEDPQYAALKAVYGERVIGFERRDPTTEVLAQTVFLHLQKALAQYSACIPESYTLRSDVKLERVRVWETSSSWAEYSED
jgi:6-pyruvoyltetrahydropterin/6-carboxytetrahydropterin synthase